MFSTTLICLNIQYTISDFSILVRKNETEKWDFFSLIIYLSHRVCISPQTVDVYYNR